MMKRCLMILLLTLAISPTVAAQTNILKQAGIKDWLSGKGSITELGNYYYILRRALPAISDTSLFPSTYPAYSPIQIMLSKYDKSTFQHITTTVLTGDTLQNDSIYYSGIVCIQGGRIHVVYDKMFRYYTSNLYDAKTFYVQLDTALNIIIPDRNLLEDDVPIGSFLIPTYTTNLAYIGFNSVYTTETFNMNEYILIDTLGNVIRRDTLGSAWQASNTWNSAIYSITPYRNNQFLVYGVNILGAGQPERSNSFYITDSDFNVTDTFSTSNTSGVRVAATPDGNFFTLSGYFGGLTEIGKYKPGNFGNPSFFRGYGIDEDDQIHAGMGLVYNSFDHKIYSVSGTHKVDPYLGYCYFPATPQALQFPYGYTEIICTDTNLNLQWKKYIRIDQHAGGCGGPWYAIVPDGREGVNVAGGWYNKNWDGNGKDTVNEFLYYITATTATDSTILSTGKNNFEIRDRLKIYPNPATDVVWIDDIEARLQSIALCDAQGRQLLKQAAIGAKAAVDIAALPQGIYFITIVTKDEEVLRRKIVKQ